MAFAYCEVQHNIMTNKNVLISEADTQALKKRGLHIAYFLVAWDLIEGAVAIAAGILANSVALIGFGIDSLIEVFAAGVTVWHLRGSEQKSNKLPLRLIAISFFILAAYVGFKSISDLLTQSKAEPSMIGIIWNIIALVIMVPLALMQKKAGKAISNKVITAQADQTWLSNYLSTSLLVGLGVNALFGWWWADPLIALLLAGYAVYEGIESWRESEEGV